jgi:hypothetical protein
MREIAVVNRTRGQYSCTSDVLGCAYRPKRTASPSWLHGETWVAIYCATKAAPKCAMLPVKSLRLTSKVTASDPFQNVVAAFFDRLNQQIDSDSAFATPGRL